MVEEDNLKCKDNTVDSNVGSRGEHERGEVLEEAQKKKENHHTQ
jgi:hypothetical protein